MGIKNSTTTLAQSWGSIEGRLVRVEVLVLFSALIWVLVEFFGSLRRRYSHGFFRFFVWAVMIPSETRRSSCGAPFSSSSK
nr:unnamed protein product [Digitaria exilis]